MSKTEHWLTPSWPAPKNIHAATTFRSGGVSQNNFSSLNLAAHVGDNNERVLQNRNIIRDRLALPAEPVWLEQVHGNQAVNASLAETLPHADASYTNQSGIVCAVMTADCLPLLVCSKDGMQVAAIHAGWRGLLAGVITNTLTAMQASAARENFLVWLGPAIGPDCFEVGAEVREAFLEKSDQFDQAFKPQHNGKWLADIYRLARSELAMLGVGEVYGGGYCTFTEHERFYSFRRDRHTGRMATLIWRE